MAPKGFSRAGLAQTPLHPERSLSNWTLLRTPDGRVGWVHSTLLK